MMPFSTSKCVISGDRTQSEVFEFGDACGDGELAPSEACEGVNLGGASCLSEGFDGGTLSCNADCTFNTSGCFENPPQPMITFTKIVDQTTLVPDGSGNTFLASPTDGFGTPSISDGNVAFRAGAGVYRNVNGVLSVVANNDTPIPGGAPGDTFGDSRFFSDPIISGENVVFVGQSPSSALSGVYKSIGGILSIVADDNTPIPDGTGNFEITAFAPPTISGENVAFSTSISGSGITQAGVYKQVDNVLQVVADRNTLIPGETGNFDNLFEVDLDGDNVVFSGVGSSNSIGGGTLYGP